MYSHHQQRMQYLVEFSLPGDQVGGEIDAKGEEEREGVSESQSEDEEKEENGVCLTPRESEYDKTSSIPHSLPPSLPVSLHDVQDVTDPLSKVEPGLQASGADVPLQCVHIRAQLIDLAAKVVTHSYIIIIVAPS